MNSAGDIRVAVYLTGAGLRNLYAKTGNPVFCQTLKIFRICHSQPAVDFLGTEYGQSQQRRGIACTNEIHASLIEIAPRAYVT
jgi:hypothetical protein